MSSSRKIECVLSKHWIEQVYVWRRFVTKNRVVSVCHWSVLALRTRFMSDDIYRTKLGHTNTFLYLHKHI